jgi:hypothetical protein
MKGLTGLPEDDQGLFGPGTDLVLSLVAVLVLIVFALNADYGFDIEAVREAQLEVVRSLADVFETQPVTVRADVYGIHIEPGGKPDIVIENEATLQRIRFGSHVLFEPDEYELQPRGKLVLASFARALRDQLEDIREISRGMPTCKRRPSMNRTSSSRPGGPWKCSSFSRRKVSTPPGTSCPPPPSESTLLWRGGRVEATMPSS